MGGGPSNPELVVAGVAAGALAFLAAAYKPATVMRDEVQAVRARTTEPFGINVFVPGSPTGDPSALGSYLESLRPDADALGVPIGEPAWDDDDWDAKIATLLDLAPPVVSFTFGCPEPAVIAALQAVGSQVWITVTQEREAVLAASAGADALCVQGTEAGAHRGTFADSPPIDVEPDLLDLVREISRLSDLPVLAAGAVMDHQGVLAALQAGALGVQCGTAFLLCPESGTSPAHRAALVDPRFTETAVTRAFSGRAARGLLNQFMRQHADAPAAYPEINNAARPLRAAAARVGDLDRLHLWAGTGYRAARDRPVAVVLDQLCGR
jgi:nitronate monooxygenase